MNLDTTQQYGRTFIVGGTNSSSQNSLYFESPLFLSFEEIKTEESLEIINDGGPIY